MFEESAPEFAICWQSLLLRDLDGRCEAGESTLALKMNGGGGSDLRQYLGLALSQTSVALINALDQRDIRIAFVKNRVCPVTDGLCFD